MRILENCNERYKLLEYLSQFRDRRFIYLSARADHFREVSNSDKPLSIRYLTLTYFTSPAAVHTLTRKKNSRLSGRTRIAFFFLSSAAHHRVGGKFKLFLLFFIYIYVDIIAKLLNRPRLSVWPSKLSPDGKVRHTCISAKWLPTSAPRIYASVCIGTILYARVISR